MKCGSFFQVVKEVKVIVPFKRLKASCLLGKAYKIRMVTVSMVFFSSVAHIKQCSVYCLNFKILFTVILVCFFSLLWPEIHHVHHCLCRCASYLFHLLCLSWFLSVNIYKIVKYDRWSQTPCPFLCAFFTWHMAIKTHILCCVSLRAHFHVVGMLWFMFLTPTNQACPLLFVLLLCLFLSLWPLQLYFIP